MPNIKIQNGREFSCETGEELLKVLRRHGVELEVPCNGKGTCGKCKLKLLSGTLSPVTDNERRLLRGDELENGIRLSCMARVLSDIEIEIPKQERRHNVLTQGYVPPFSADVREGYAAAVDIGTTTVALSLVDLNNGKELAQASTVNAQKQFGLDVLTRISYEYEQGEQGIQALQQVMVTSLNTLLEQLCQEAGIAAEDLSEIVVAANCAMTHMLLAVDARPLGKAPYAPQFLEAQELLASSIGLRVGAQTKLYCLPQVSAYIGGDIVAGACVCQLAQQQETTLFVDIGTNGEIILAHQGKLLSCSCAAGPALEGMNISCGMRAAEGAVEDIHIEEQVKLTTIGGGTPLGLCGSGILAAVRELVKHKYVKKSGVFVALDKAPEPNILRLNGSKREAVLCSKPELLVTQDDVRQVQLAKGAILSGFRVLLKEAGITMEQVDKVIIAGQFGSHLPVDSLIGIGLLPECVREKLQYVGNSSKSGAYMALLSQKKRKEMEQLARKIDYIELAQTKDYERIFAESMSFELY